MKNLIILLGLIICSHSFANGSFTNLKKGSTNLSMAHAKISNVEAICPQEPGKISCKAIGSMVKVVITLNGCLDQLGGYFSSFDIVNGKGILAVGAINVGNKGSLTTLCYAAPFEVVDIYVPFEGEIEIVNLDYTHSSIK